MDCRLLAGSLQREHVIWIQGWASWSNEVQVCSVDLRVHLSLQKSGKPSASTEIHFVWSLMEVVRVVRTSRWIQAAVFETWSPFYFLKKKNCYFLFDISVVFVILWSSHFLNVIASLISNVQQLVLKFRCDLIHAWNSLVEIIFVSQNLWNRILIIWSAINSVNVKLFSSCYDMYYLQ